MSRIDEVRARVNQADYVLLALTEIQCGGDIASTPAEIACLIGGSATTRDLGLRMRALFELGVLSVRVDSRGAVVGYQLTSLGEQLMLEDAGNWTPEPSERARRERELLEAAQRRSN